MALSSVMHDRFQVFDELSELWSVVKQSTMTSEYGGATNEEESIEDFRKYIEANLEALRNFFVFELDMMKVRALKNTHETVGTFRK
jgi:hypothetical protein